MLNFRRLGEVSKESTLAEIFLLRCEAELRDNAFEAELAGVAKHSLAVAVFLELRRW